MDSDSEVEAVREDNLLSWQSVPGGFLWPPSFSLPEVEHVLQPLPCFSSCVVQSSKPASMLQDMWSNKTLNLGCFGPRFLTILVQGSSHNILVAISFIESETLVASAQ